MQNVLTQAHMQELYLSNYGAILFSWSPGLDQEIYVQYSKHFEVQKQALVWLCLYVFFKPACIFLTTPK